MNRLLYDPAHLRAQCGPGGRVIILAFCRAAHIFIARMLEAAVKSGNRDFRNIVVVALPWFDVISKAGGPDEIVDFARTYGVDVSAGMVVGCPRARARDMTWVRF